MMWTVWVYGSVARGNYNSASDLDVLVVAEEAPAPSDVEALVSPFPCSDHLSVARYSWAEIASMAEYGSLFLWHIRMEGKPLTRGLGTDKLTALLNHLPAYSGATRDINGFKTGIQDVDRSLSDGGDPAFELGVVATVIRHASILACAQLGIPTYDRATSIALAFKAYGLESYSAGAIQIYQFRLSTARSLSPVLEPTIELAVKWSRVAYCLIERMETQDAR